MFFLSTESMFIITPQIWDRCPQPSQMHPTPTHLPACTAMHKDAMSHCICPPMLPLWDNLTSFISKIDLTVFQQSDVVSFCFQIPHERWVSLKLCSFIKHLCNAHSTGQGISCDEQEVMVPTPGRLPSQHHAVGLPRKNPLGHYLAGWRVTLKGEKADWARGQERRTGGGEERVGAPEHAQACLAGGGNLPSRTDTEIVSGDAEWRQWVGKDCAEPHGRSMAPGPGATLGQTDHHALGDPQSSSNLKSDSPLALSLGALESLWEFRLMLSPRSSSQRVWFGTFAVDTRWSGHTDFFKSSPSDYGLHSPIWEPLHFIIPPVLG